MNDKNQELDKALQNAPKYPERAMDPNAFPANAEGVYAGPVPPQGMTYAGPAMKPNAFVGFMDFQNSMMAQQAAAGMSAPAAEPDRTDQKQCSHCYAWSPARAKFCTECGQPFAAEQP